MNTHAAGSSCNTSDWFHARILLWNVQRLGMVTRFRAYEVETGIFTALIDLVRNPNFAGHSTGSITPIFHRQTGSDITEQTLGETIAISFPAHTPDDYIVRHLLSHIEVSSEDVGTRINYTEVT